MLAPCAAAVWLAVAIAQDQPDPRQRARTARELSRQGSAAIPALRTLLKDPALEVRLEAVKSVVAIGTQHSLVPLVEATRDADPEIQIRATDGLVNFYLPGYVQTGLGATLRRAGGGIVARFTDSNEQIVDPFVQPGADVIEALGKLARGATTMEARANAARAAGVLRGRQAIPDLITALRSKDSRILYEALVALRKIREPSAGPEIAFLLRDLDERVQVAAIEATGVLVNREALPRLREILQRSENIRVRRATLSAIAMMPDPASR
ncbi:MAG: HEAT repeat domain-containing protein, partial [Bryobacteraceae bacterium]